MPNELLPLAANVYEILLSLSRGRQHGYAIISEIRERTGGDVVIGTSTLYATIQRMLRQGMLQDAGEVPSDSGAPRRTYAITALGQQLVRLETDRLRRATAAAARILDEAPSPAGAPAQD